MSRTGVVAIVLFSLTALLLATTAGQCGAQYFGAVAIKADGSVSPPSVPIWRDGDTYTLTGDLGSIRVERNNIILDGNGHTLPGFVTTVDGLGNNITELNSGGVYLKNVENVTVKNLTIKNSQFGIYLEQCSNITVSGNTITGTQVPVPQGQATGGIFVWQGHSNIIVDNNLANNYKAIYIGYEHQNHQNLVARNTIENSSYGIIILTANNTIYQNRFINNKVQAYLSGEASNVWDYDKKGNFWSGYDGTDADGDGIGDTPYVIDENNQDSYPLTASYNDPEPTPPPAS